MIVIIMFFDIIIYRSPYFLFGLATLCDRKVIGERVFQSLLIYRRY